jgi:hypothetical protein
VRTHLLHSTSSERSYSNSNRRSYSNSNGRSNSNRQHVLQQQSYPLAL